MLKAHFGNEEAPKNMGYTTKGNPDWIPPKTHHSIQTYIQAVQNDLNSTPDPKKKHRQNLSKDESEALEQLRTRDDIVITKADKGGGVVIQNTTDYIAEANRQLTDESFYEEKEEDLTPHHNKLVNKAIDMLCNDNLLSDKAGKALKNDNPQTAKFYTLPKVHKKGTPGRPIISALNTATTNIAKFVDHHLQPIAETLPSYIKDTGAFLRKISNTKGVPRDAILVTLDVKALYTSIPHKEGINSAAQYLEKRTSPSIATRVIIKFLALILYLNNFSFNDKHYLQ